VNTLIDHRGPPSRLERIASAFTGAEPIEADSLEQFIAIVCLVRGSADSPANIRVTPVCETDAKPSVGRAVGGIGEFCYGVECSAFVEQPAQREFGPVAQIVWTCDVASRFGSRRGFGDEAQRETAESLCLTQAQELRTELELRLPPSERLAYVG
jgi:hypothetical protein